MDIGNAAGGAIGAVAGTALVGGSVLYVLVIAWLLTGIARSRRTATTSESTPSVSVIVAARDEEERIRLCVEALQRQAYEGVLQIIVVDDRSHDGTGQIVDRMRRDSAVELWLLRADDPLRYACPKKSALSVGIEAARGDLLLFTDADCEPPPDWVRTMVASFAPGVGLVAGFAFPQAPTHLRQRLLAVDNLGVAALAEGSIGMGSALACTGRSMAYRRAVYDEVGGFDAIGHLVSGDDVYFLRHVARRSDCRIVYCAAATAAVASSPAPMEWQALYHQKARHAAKAAHYRGGARWLGVAMYLYHAALLSGAVLAILGALPWALFGGCWLTRWAADGALLTRFAPRPVDRKLVALLPLVEILYIPYVLLFVPLGRAGWFQWRRRAHGAPRLSHS
jgi:cellulose synthase/poly-beta-1,6-N-acetylglucosamine synthase-like glycosyltransferase